MPVFEVDTELKLVANVKIKVTADNEDKAVARVEDGIRCGDIVGDRVDVMEFVNMAAVEGDVDGVKLLSEKDEDNDE
jgi:hypothetical protein